MKIVFCTTCKNRTFHLEQTLPKNLAGNPRSTFLVLDYGSTDNLRDYLLPQIQADRLVVYSFPAAERFHMAHAKNLAARCAMLEDADAIVTLDADNFAGDGFESFVAANLREGTFLRPHFEAIPKWPHPDRPPRGFAGRLAIRTQDFIKAGGYDELYDTWRGEDFDFNARMARMGYKPAFIENGFLETIPHGAEVRFKEYPHAKDFEKADGWRIEGKETATVVNYGNLGCGTVYRNYASKPIELRPLPTRVFGIGLHKTATTSLDKAFQMLGFDSLHWGSGEAPAIWQEVASAGRSKTLERFYAACDLPIPLLYRQLDKAYPGSKFILTLRDEAKWLKSVERLWDSRYNPTRWEWDVWPISNRLHTALYGRADFDAPTMLSRYRQHNAEVLEYFKNRPDDLLLMDMDHGAGWRQLCEFLGQPIPGEPFPRRNVTNERNGFQGSF